MFDGGEVLSTVRVMVSEDIVASMKTLRVGDVIKVKCAITFVAGTCSLSLTADEIELVSSVKLLIE